MKSEDAVRALRFELLQQAARKAKEGASLAEADLLGHTVAALSWVLDDEDLPEWDFLDAVAET